VVNPEDFIRDQFPTEQWPILPTILRTAYKATDELVADQPILQTVSAGDNKGRVVSWAVDFGIQSAIVNGTLKCDYRWMPFAKPTGRYLELRFSHSRASVSQVADARKQPRDVAFRDNARLNNQRVLDIEEFKKEQEINGLPHFLIIHGHQTLQFSHIGVPSALSKTKWEWLSPNLMKMPHAVPGDSRPPPEDTDTDFDSVKLLKEELERWIRDNGGK
jgi:hypothetical protein